MKTSVHRFAICLAGLVLVSPVVSNAQIDKLYIRADAGGNWTPSTELKEFFGESLAPNSKVKFSPGGRFAAAAGYQLTDWLSPEVETGIMANSIDSITDASRVDAVFSNVPLLGNIRIQCPRWEQFRPYLGGGAGVSFPVLDADRIRIGGTSIHGSDADAVFAYQAFGGLRFKLNDHMGLSLEYHYFHADGARWEADFTSDKMRLGGTETHAVSVAFDYHF
jgi:opacity protein-like surface antigen